MIESDPALCAVHAGVNSGRGAKVGNKNAMKHGLYRAVLTADDIAHLEMVKSKTLLHELVLTRVALRRLSSYLNKKGLCLADVLAIMPVLCTMVRTVAYMQECIDEDEIDWDEVLDDLGAEGGMDI
jgi:hypothetical protein